MSRTYRPVERVPEQIDTVTCDRCGREDDDDGLEGQEFLAHYMHCGYGSIFGDLSYVQLDLCQHCVQELLGKWVRVVTPESEEASK